MEKKEEKMMEKYWKKSDNERNHWKGEKRRQWAEEEQENTEDKKEKKFKGKMTGSLSKDSRDFYFDKPLDKWERVWLFFKIYLRAPRLFAF